MEIPNTADTSPSLNEELVPRGFDLRKLADRLDELADCVSSSDPLINRKVFKLRIPADPYYDADLVLSTAADLIRASKPETIANCTSP